MTEALRHLEIAESTRDRWRAIYGGMKLDAARRLKDEAENARLKKLLAGPTQPSTLLAGPPNPPEPLPSRVDRSRGPVSPGAPLAVAVFEAFTQPGTKFQRRGLRKAPM